MVAAARASNTVVVGNDIHDGHFLFPSCNANAKRLSVHPSDFLPRSVVAMAGGFSNPLMLIVRNSAPFD